MAAESSALHKATRWLAPATAALACLMVSSTALDLISAPNLVTMAFASVALAFIAISAFTRSKLEGQNSSLASSRWQLERRLECDPLTGLMNRSAFNRALEDLRSVAPTSGSIIILFFDLDRFKDVNDTLGHRVGDQLLVEVATRARSTLPDAVAFARLGGDEFAAIVPLERSVRAQHYGEAIVEIVAQPFNIDDHRVHVAASVGIAIGDAFVDDGHELLRRADAAMYDAKGAPRGSCRIFDDKLSGRQTREAFIRAELESSLQEGAFTLLYQPLIDARTGLVSSAEALLRTSSPGLSMVDTASLISIAEKSGQIIPLTEVTIDIAFAAIRELQGTPIALNISPVYFRNPHFVHHIVDRLLQSSTPPELLTVEVTEGVLISDMAAARESIAQLRDVGIKVFLDDFGTCYSSMSYLQHLELDGLKLDKTFLRNIGDQNRASRIIKAMIDFGHSLDMKVVMEGVESEWQVRLLQLLNCDLLQGFELGAPMKLEALRELNDRLCSPQREERNLNSLEHAARHITR